jgi:hypothetical protein
MHRFVARFAPSSVQIFFEYKKIWPHSAHLLKNASHNVVVSLRPQNVVHSKRCMKWSKLFQRGHSPSWLVSPYRFLFLSRICSIIGKLGFYLSIFKKYSFYCFPVSALFYRGVILQIELRTLSKKQAIRFLFSIRAFYLTCGNSMNRIAALTSTQKALFMLNLNAFQ